jgi:hypothetical protein
MKQIIFVFLLLPILFIFSCTDDFGEQNTDKDAFKPGSGVFIVNEGNWGQGNGSLSFYSFSDGKVYEDVFSTANNRPLGDLPAFMAMGTDIALASVNNSGTIEIFDPQTMKSKFTVSALNSPRQIQIIDNQTIAVSHLADSGITLINPITGQVKNKIMLGISSEAMLLHGQTLFVSNWSRYYINSDNRVVLMVDLATGSVFDTLEVGLEPQSMVMDKHNRLWVLCSGGWDNSEYPTLHRISLGANPEHKIYTFPDKNTSPTHLSINGLRDTVYFLNQSVYRMGVDDNELPLTSFIPNGNSYFYALSVHPGGKGIFLSDPLDFQQNGIIYRFDQNGNPLGNFRAGIIPGSFCFN